MEIAKYESLHIRVKCLNDFGCLLSFEWDLNLRREVIKAIQYIATAEISLPKLITKQTTSGYKESQCVKKESNS